MGPLTHTLVRPECMSETQTQGVNSVEIAVTVLETIAELGASARAIDIARLSGLSKSRLHKYLVSLCRSQLIYQDPQTSLYSLGSKLSTLGDAAKAQNGALVVINNALCQLRDRLNISTGLAIIAGDTPTLINYNRSNKNIELDYKDNTQIPLLTSAAGKIFLTFSARFRSQHLLTEEEEKQILHDGYAIRLTETEGIPGARAIACPVFNTNRSLIGAAVIMGLLPDDNDELRQLADRLLNAVKEIRIG